MSRKSQDPKGRGCIRHCNGGFSLLELVIVIVIISVLLVLAISRLLALMVDAERVTMETVAGTLRSAIGMKVAESIVKSKVKDLPAFEGSNPMALLAETPHNYLGELDGVDPAKLEDGNWYFDKRDKTLVYLVRNKGFFVGGQANPPRARFAVRLVYSDRNGNGVFDQGKDAIEGMRLNPVEKYSWSRN
ncbi:MAG: prepilin-type N-terminal cleavage/methylation domain-containing protein [Sulfuricaulis sp.]|uniref:prepilin-type N-terminal cleavage/methylation domain-containing protein n=1 Tax=Sulfuricaulis sp. TaxID=2003553 RepID=UPI0025EE163E|nr:prepilin-type N-terminal cleavage/methylation domain-containing protein [Sulfuricaulis sp.]MCR4347468.1 prepilin-type N-terminal cleavage/methylation domain-containing protein [Sulfuricaulis sp.]